MKLKVGSPVEVPAGVNISAGTTPYVAPKYVDPDYDPFVLWSLIKSPVHVEGNQYTVPNLTTSELSKVIDTLTLAGIEAMLVTRIEKNLWDIHYYD